MGCYNGTCGATQLPIHGGDSVIFLFLTKVPIDEPGAGFCYSNELWTLRSLPIFAYYNDYGGIEEYKENWNTEFIVDKFKKDAIPKKAGKNKYRDLAVVPEDLTLEGIMKLIEVNRLYVKGINPVLNKNKTNVGFMMVHKFAWDHFVNSAFDSIFGDITIKKVIQDGNKWSKYILENTEKSQDLNFWFSFEQNNPRNTFVQILYRSSTLDNVCVLGGIKDYLRMWENEIFEGRYCSKKNKEIIRLVSEVFMFNYGMNTTRKHFSPQCGAGSQSADYEVYENLLQATYDHVVRKKKELEW